MRILLAAALLAAWPAAAQQHGHGAAPTPPAYAGLETRPVKGLSDQQLADLRAGRGMSLALPAELNGYPGPLHALELADALQLTPVQRERVAALTAAMRAEAIALGAQVIAAEGALDQGFAARTVTPASLEVSTAAVGRAQAALRAAHLRAHLTMPDVLTPDQVQRYAVLRGYAAAPGSGQPRH